MVGELKKGGGMGVMYCHLEGVNYSAFIKYGCVCVWGGGGGIHPQPNLIKNFAIQLYF